jgi:hypothetical protein
VTGDGDRDGPGDVHPDEREDRPELDVGAAFAAIVADWATPPPPEGARPWPAAEDVEEDRREAGGHRAGGIVERGHPDGVGPVAAGPDGAGPDVLGPDAGRFHPMRRGPRHRLPDGTGAPGAYELGTGDGEEDDPHDRFVPPEPPPITSTDLVSRLAWLGVIGGPLFLLVAALVWRALPTLVVIVALAAFIGGFITLVARLPRDRDDGPDDGAVV